jgi:uncharacterized membrane protein
MAKVRKANKIKYQKNKQNIHPILEVGVILIKLLVIITAGSVFLISLSAGAEWYTITIRTSLAMIVVGLIGWYINWILGKWVLVYEMRRLEEERNQTNNDLYNR